ncbi:MAG: hypothetical protein IBJ11_02670 [Phycisphaerales bacterium]|nr:hypothetical protein [Phycisphaerales bacterium]
MPLFADQLPWLIAQAPPEGGRLGGLVSINTALLGLTGVALAAAGGIWATPRVWSFLFRRRLRRVLDGTDGPVRGARAEKSGKVGVGVGVGVAGRGVGGEESRAAAGAAEELRHFIADARAVTRESAGLIDDRAARLERLIVQADERLKLLAGLLERLDESAGAAAEGGDRSSETGARGGAGGEGGETESGWPRRGGAPRYRDDASDPLSRRVLELADEGLTPVEIARRLEEQTGKVELILALRGR